MQPSHALSFLLCLFLNVQPALDYKILIFSPRVGYSHVNYFGRIADILVEAGYDVVVYLVNLDPEVKTNGTKLARVIEDPHSPVSLVNKDLTSSAWLNDGDSLLEIYKMFSSMTNAQTESCLNVLKNEKLMDRLREEKFDLGITELISFCGYGIFEKIGLKTYVTAFTSNLFEVLSDRLGVSSNPSYVPAAMGELFDAMSYAERLSNFITYLSVYSLFHFVILAEISKLQKYWPGMDIEEAVGRSSLAFVNSEELLEFPRLLSHKIIYMGGIAVKKPKNLNKEYEELMDTARSGAVLISFGSVAKSVLMTDHQKKAFCEAFGAFPEVKFIWKYEINDTVAADLPNVFKRAWVPQTDLLGHANLRVFISHCGQNSLTESVHAGVPLICIPLFGDQMRNAKTAEKRNIGMLIHKNDISKKSLVNALEEILHGTKYRKSAKVLAQMIRDKPQTPKDRLLKYTEFAIKYGPIERFDVFGNELTIFQYYLIDIIVPVILFFILFVYFFVRAIFAVCNFFSHRKSKIE